MLVAAVYLSGCASPKMVVATAGPNAGITITSVKLSGGPYANGQIYVTTNNANYGTQWSSYQGAPPAPRNMIWHGTVAGPDNPGTCAPGQTFVQLKANQPVNFASNPVSVNVAAGYRTKIAVTYP